MSFTAAVDHLLALTPELSPTAPRRKFDLEHMRILARALGDPHYCFPAILIAGTNGKGSTAATLASILTAAGLRTALYTSPHLTRVTERIRTSGGCDSERSEESPRLPLASACHSERSEESPHLSLLTSNLQPATLLEIPEESFARLYFHVDSAASRLVTSGALPHHPSFFETLTALAFLYFADRPSDGGAGHPVDIAVLEVGLGGRLDATNIVHPLLSVITDIALDHQDYLGSTIAEIAREKAGILRANGTLITLPQHPDANQAIGEAAIALNVRAISAAEFVPGRTATYGLPTPDALHPNRYHLTIAGEHVDIVSPLPGEHQQRNIALAIASALELRNQNGYNIPNSAIVAGIADTSWPGRLELLPPNLLLDVAHNPAGAWTLRAAIHSLPAHASPGSVAPGFTLESPRTLIFSCLRDKDLTEISRILFPLFDNSTPTAPQAITPIARQEDAVISTGAEGEPEKPVLSLSKEPPHLPLSTSNLQPPTFNLILTPIDNPRAASLESLLAAARALSIPAHTAPSPSEALALARALTPPSGLIVATGSIYLIGALRTAALVEPTELLGNPSL